MKYDVGIIGGGPGGYSAAFEAAKNGLSVILFESDQLGGTCLNRGCIPAKYLSHIARIHSLPENYGDFGFSSANNGIDFTKIQKKKEQIIQNLREQLTQRLVSSKINIIHQKAAIKEPGIICCGTNTCSVMNTVIATGANVKEPLFQNFYNSNHILELKTLPETMKIVGGGTIAAEFSLIFRQLGVNVKIQTRSPRILKKWDRETSVSLTRLLKEQGIQIETNCDTETLQKNDADICFSAAGMEPNIPDICPGLLETGENGGILVNEYGETSCKGIYAIGDVTEGSVQLAHHAMEEGRRAIWHILKKELPKRSTFVRCIYTHPEIAEAGCSEEQAKAANISYVTVKAPLYSNSMNLIFGGGRSYIRLIADKKSKTLIGAQMMCERASDLISELALAIYAKIPLSEMFHFIRPHPSFSEGITDAFELLKEKLT